MDGPVVPRRQPAGAPQQEVIADGDTTWVSGVTVRPGQSIGKGTASFTLDLPGKSWDEVAADNKAFQAATKTGKNVTVKVPVTMGGANPAAVASGAEDAHWKEFAESLAGLNVVAVDLTVPDGTDPAEAKSAWLAIAEELRKAAPKTKVGWGAPLGMTAEQVQAAWPGDGKVDYLATTVPPTGQWLKVLNGEGGLADRLDLAQAKKLPLEVQWAITEKTPTAWVVNMRNWVHDADAAKVKVSEHVNITGTGPAAKTYQKLW